MKIENGILQGVEYIPSPNRGGAIVPKFIVLHYTAGWTMKSAVNTLCNPRAKVSAQFVVDRDGTIVQLVRCDRRAWHAGPSKFMGYRNLNSHSIGIEFVNPGFLKLSKSGEYLDSTGKHKVPKSRLEGYDLSLVARNPRIGSSKVVWPAYTDAQLQAGEELIKAICDEYNILGACTHEEIDARGWKTDPGYSFPVRDFKLMTDQFESRAFGGPVAPSDDKAVVKVKKLNGREGPSLKAPVVTVLRLGDHLKILEDRGEWSLVETKRARRPVWLADRYLEYI